MREIQKSEFLRLAFLRIIELEDALRPFAKMHRLDYNLNQLVCERGTGSDKTIITTVDFQKAHEIL